MVLGTGGLQLVSAGDELLTESRCVLDDLLRVRLPGWLGCLKERSGDTGNGVVVWASLARREDRLINPLLEI